MHAAQVKNMPILLPCHPCHPGAVILTTPAAPCAAHLVQNALHAINRVDSLLDGPCHGSDMAVHACSSRCIPKQGEALLSQDGYWDVLPSLRVSRMVSVNVQDTHCSR